MENAQALCSQILRNLRESQAVQNIIYTSFLADGLDIGLAGGTIAIQGPAATFR